MTIQTTAIKNFLNAKASPDLAALYTPEMEVQVIVSQENGERITGDYKGKSFTSYTDGVRTWYPLRIPHDANKNPTYEDKEMTYDLAQYALGIGLTGWNFRTKESYWVGYDFDALIGHSVRHTKKLSDEQLKEIIHQVQDIPWVTVRRSTSGKGLHLYVFLEPKIKTETHIEHAALARSILAQLSLACNFDFSAKVDALGYVLWIWHQKLQESNQGLSLIKSGVPLSSILPDWRDHIPVITGQRQRTSSIQITNPDVFEEMCGQKIKIKLDKEHIRLIDYLQSSGYYTTWDADRWMLVTHTYALKKAHAELGLVGPFDTISEGTDPNSPNCFAFTMKNGVWIIRRFTPGIAESSTWSQDNKGFTRCFFNKEPDVATACKSFGGLESSSGSYVFKEAVDALKAVKMLGFDLNLPVKLMDRKTKIKAGSMGTNKFTVEIDAELKDPELEGWIHERKHWQKVFRSNESVKLSDVEIYNFDDTIRHVVSEDKIDLGWYIRSEDLTWHFEPLQHVKLQLEGAYNYTNKEMKSILGSNIIKAWEIVNRPFEPEYPGGRTWNKNGAQLRFAPSLDLDNLSYPTWTKLLDHLGQSLTPSINQNEWCKKNNILTGADYLKCWVASVFQFPYAHLPYLFFYGNENTGKSSFHEALSLLITKGYVRAETALRGRTDFNAELFDGIIAVVEEQAITKDKIALARMRDWVMSPKISIHKKGFTPILIPNTLHFIQCSNDFSDCPVLPGDSRITVIPVQPIEEEIPKYKFMQLIEHEAPDFLAAVKNLDLPVATGRLNIPVILTDEKKSIQQSNRNALELFLDEYCYFAPGKHILISDFYEAFREKSDPQEVTYWTKIKISRTLPPQYVKGRLGASWAYGNLSLTKPSEEDLKKPKYVVINEQLYLESMIKVT